MRWLWIGWCGISFYRFWPPSLSLCFGDVSRVFEHPLLFFSVSFCLCFISPYLYIFICPPHSFILSLHVCTRVYVCAVCLCRGCVRAEAYHNKQSKSPVGIRTFSLPPSPCGTGESRLIPQHTFKSLNQLKRPEWHQPCCQTHTHIYSCMHART